MAKKPRLARPWKKASGQMVSCPPRPMTSSSAGSPLSPAVSYSISMPLALARVTFPPLRCVASLPRLSQPHHGFDGGAQGGVLRRISSAAIVRNRRPGSGILDIPAKRLEPESAVGTSEEVDTSVVLAIFDAVDDNPGSVDARGHLVSIARVWPHTNRRAASATRPCRRARAPAAGSAARPD